VGHDSAMFIQHGLQSVSSVYDTVWLQNRPSTFLMAVALLSSAVVVDRASLVSANSVRSEDGSIVVSIAASTAVRHDAIASSNLNLPPFCVSIQHCRLCDIDPT